MCWANRLNRKFIEIVVGSSFNTKFLFNSLKGEWFRGLKVLIWVLRRNANILYIFFYFLFHSDPKATYRFYHFQLILMNKNPVGSKESRFLWESLIKIALPTNQCTLFGFRENETFSYCSDGLTIDGKETSFFDKIDKWHPFQLKRIVVHTPNHEYGIIHNGIIIL